MYGRIGLYVGGMECYWKETGMQELRDALERDGRALAGFLRKKFDVVYPGLVTNREDSARAARIFRDKPVDLALVYHATYIHDAMSIDFVEELGDIFMVILLSQGVKGIPRDFSLIDYGRCWGNNSTVQIITTLKRMKKRTKFGYLIGPFDSPHVMRELMEYVKAGKAVKALKGARVVYLPHRCDDAPMYDTFPDDTKMMAQTGVEIHFRYVQDVVEAMGRISDADTESLLRKLYNTCEVIEPPVEEIQLAAKQALALEQVVKEHEVDALAIDFAPQLMVKTHMIPALGMARIADQGVVVSCEGDLTVAVGGLIIRGLTGKPIHNFEHLMFDEDKNWILGGHDGGSAPFSLAHREYKIRLRNTMYVDYKKVSGAPTWGVVPEFITQPGPVTLLNLYRAEEGYEMRVITGESVATEPRPVHMEHTIMRPDCPLESYFRRLAQVGVDHHFALVHEPIERELEKVAQMLDMKLEYITERS